MSISESQHQDCTVQDLLEVVEGQQETIEELQATVEEQQETIEQLAKDNAEDRQRLTEAEERLDDVEGQESTGSNPTPTPQTEKTADAEPLTPIERLLEGDRQDVAANVTPSVERAICLFENLPDWGTSTPKGITLLSDDRPKDLLEAATGESLAWQQYYRAAETLESLSKGAVTFIDHRKHGKTLVFHDDTDVHQRATETNTEQSQTVLAAD